VRSVSAVSERRKWLVHQKDDGFGDSDHADPPVGATVATTPHDLMIWFTQGLEPAFSTVAVTDAGGARVDEGKPRISGNTMSVALTALSAGTYHVHWHAVSVPPDGATI